MHIVEEPKDFDIRFFRATKDGSEPMYCQLPDSSYPLVCDGKEVFKV